MDSSTPPILRLPAELLTDILSLVVPHIYPHGWNAAFIKTPTLKSPFHAVRSTCRTFRWIVDDLPFWRDDNFDVTDIILFTPDRESDEPFNCYFLDVLLCDPHLRQCLGQKKGWLIWGLYVYRALTRQIPNFGQCVHRLELCEYVNRNQSVDDIADSF